MKWSPYIALLTLVIFISFTSCRDARIDPYEEETSNYSIYGALNISETEHVLRVRDLNVVHNDTSSSILNATVTFHDLEAGNSQILKDSVIQFPAGYTHNFKFNKQLKPRTTYKITVEDSDGKSSSSTFTTPGISEVRVEPIGPPYSCVQSIRFSFTDILPTENIRWEIGFVYQDQIYYFEITPPYCTIQSYVENTSQWIVRTTPLFLLDRVFPRPGDVFRNCNDLPTPRVRCADLSSENVYLRLLHLGPDWNKVYPYYPEDPQDIQSVENGLGFLGAYYEKVTTFRVITD